MIIFMDGCHQSGSYKGTMLAACVTQLCYRERRRLGVVLAKCCRMLRGFKACNYVRLGASALKNRSTSVWKREP